jgi:hypothetical protein
MTGQLKQNWVDFLFQVFAYAALAPEITDVYLVLPLQEVLWHHDVRGWSTKGAYKTYLEDAISKKRTNIGAAQELVCNCRIGNHMHKLKSLAMTIFGLPKDRPSQIFLAGPQSSKLNIADEELASAGSIPSNYYVHSPYIINYLTLAIKGHQVLRGISSSPNIDLLKQKLEQIVPEVSCISEEDSIIYELTEKGDIKKLSTYDGLPSDENYLNISLAETNKLFGDLLEIEEQL